MTEHIRNLRKPWSRIGFPYQNKSKGRACNAATFSTSHTKKKTNKEKN